MKLIKILGAAALAATLGLSGCEKNTNFLEAGDKLKTLSKIADIYIELDEMEKSWTHKAIVNHRRHYNYCVLNPCSPRVNKYLCTILRLDWDNLKKIHKTYSTRNGRFNRKIIGYHLEIYCD